MQKIKSLIVAAILVCSLSVGVRAGDIGTPGYVPPTGPSTSSATGDIGTPGMQCPDTEATATQQEFTTTETYDFYNYSSDFMLYMFWTALTLF